MYHYPVWGKRKSFFYPYISKIINDSMMKSFLCRCIITLCVAKGRVFFYQLSIWWLSLTTPLQRSCSQAAFAPSISWSAPWLFSKKGCSLQLKWLAPLFLTSIFWVIKSPPQSHLTNSPWPMRDVHCCVKVCVTFVSGFRGCFKYYMFFKWTKNLKEKTII